MTGTRAPPGLRYAPHAAILSVGYVVFAYAAVPDVLRARLDITFASFGLLMSAALGAFVVAQWPASRLATRYATADVLLAATVAHALLGVALDLTGSFRPLLALRFAWGLAGGLLLSVGATQVARLHDGGSATFQQGVYGGMLTLGGALGFLLAPRFAAGPGLLGVHAFGAVLAVPAVAMLWRHRRGRDGANWTAPPAETDDTDASSLRVALAPVVLLASLCYVAIIASYVTLSTFVTDYFRNLGVTGPLNALVLVTATGGRVLGGSLARRGTVDARVVFASTVAAAVGLVALTAATGAALTVLPLVVMLAVSVPFGAVYNVAADATVDEATALATVVAAGNVAALALPALTGALRDLTGSYRPGFLVMAALNALAAVAAVAIATRTTTSQQ